MRDWLDEPIVDPTLPKWVRKLLANAPPPVPGPPTWARWLVAVGATVAGGSGVLFTLAASRTDLESASLAAVAVLAMTLFFIGLCRPGVIYRRSERYAGRYIVPADLDDPALDLLARARQAAMEVTGSRAHRLGLLDAVANDVVLPERLWEIAALLRTHTELRAEQAEAMAEVMTPELEAVLERQRDALGRSVAAVEEQVRELERYAFQVRAADAALRAHDLRKSDDRYRDLLARTGDEEGLSQLIDQADALARILRRDLE